MSEKTFNVNISVNCKSIIDLLISAFEGGSNYWCWMLESKMPSDISIVPEEYRQYDHLASPWGDGFIKLCDKYEYFDNDEEIKKSSKYPNGVKVFILNEESIVKGLEIFATKYTNHFADWYDEDSLKWDATTADVFLQCCL